MLSTMYSLLVFFLTLATFATAFPLNLFGHGTFAHEKRQTVTKYMFVFGNSYTKVGFDFSKAAPSAANPIGNPSFPSTSTTCGTGNLNWVEHLSTTYNNSLMLTYDLAAGGALVNKTLIDPVVSTTDLVGQVSLWNSNAEKHQKTGAWTKDNTLFAIWLGVNDVYRGYNTTSDLDTLYQTDLNQLFTQAIHLYNNGAKNFIFLSVPPIHRSPLVLSLQNSTETAENIWNAKLQDFVSRFNKTHTVNTWLVDTSVAFNQVLNNPTKYGAPNATCYNSDGKSCVWWDHFHPGASIQKCIAEGIAKNVTTFFKT